MHTKKIKGRLNFMKGSTLRKLEHLLEHLDLDCLALKQIGEDMRAELSEDERNGEEVPVCYHITAIADNIEEYIAKIRNLQSEHRKRVIEMLDAEFE